MWRGQIHCPNFGKSVILERRNCNKIEIAENPNNYSGLAEFAQLYGDPPKKLHLLLWLSCHYNAVVLLMLNLLLDLCLYWRLVQGPFKERVQYVNTEINTSKLIINKDRGLQVF